MRRRQRGQSVVEFGIIAILFTLILFAIADFGLLLNDWLSVSSDVRQIARDAAVGSPSCSPSECAFPELWNEATALKIPGVTADTFFASRYCCDTKDPSSSSDHGAAVQLIVTYYKQCTPGVSGCQAIQPGDAGNFDSRYTSSDPNNPFNRIHGLCTTWSSVTPAACQYPAPPAARGQCQLGPTAPCPGDSVAVTMIAAGAQVITPLVRPFFGGPACPDTSTPSHCYVNLASTVTMRFEGDTLL